MDVSMPDMDGIDATKVIKQEVPTTAVIMLTGYENTDYLRDAIVAGASGYLVKGVSAEVLREGLSLVKNGESLVDTKLLGGLLTNIRQSVQAFDVPAPKDPMDELTPLELDVLQGVVEGMTNTQIAIKLHYSVGTIKNAVQRIIEKLGVSDRTQAAVRAVQSGRMAG
jgi:DNA-binding NarL/FixJ family response regulator